MKKYAIEINEISKHYGSQLQGQLALDRISFTVKPGQLFGLVGPDGAGKTSLIRILSTVMLPSSGSADINQMDIISQSRLIRPLIGYMPQNFSLYRDLTVEENLEFFANINDIPHDRQQARFAQLLAFTNLEDFKGRRSENLSGGMRKKLALACALVHQPEVLLLDEPTTGVDPISRREFWTILAGIAQQGVTILISTPYMDEAERCQSVGLLQKGRLITVNEPKVLTASLPFEVLELTAENLEKAGSVVAGGAKIEGLRIVGDRMRIQVKQTAIAQKRISESLRLAGFKNFTLRQARKTMEDVFLHITEAKPWYLN